MPRYHAIAFYIIPHLDDWQLFMNPNVIRELSDGSKKVVFVHTTANDAGGGESYWRANEEAAICSIRHGISHLMESSGVRDRVPINKRMLNRWQGGNAVSYFLRLPDGNVTGGGFISQGFQSLRKLYRQETPFIQAVDRSAIYAGWQDFVDTLQAVIDYETDGIASVTVNHPEPDPSLNPGDHSDHWTTGLAVQSLPKYGRYRRLSYTGYDLWNDPAGLGGDDLFWKI